MKKESLRVIKTETFKDIKLENKSINSFLQLRGREVLTASKEADL